jgi:hypothetical protein
MKKLNDWPTFPQIIVNGELIGGLDILKVSRHDSLTSWPECMLTLVSFPLQESIDSGELKDMLS